MMLQIFAFILVLMNVLVVALHGDRRVWFYTTCVCGVAAFLFLIAGSHPG